MTVERKIVVGLDDIQAVSFECEKCHSRLTLPPDKIGEIPQRCEQNRSAWQRRSVDVFGPPSQVGGRSEMTVERKIVVGLDDIQAVSFECEKCHSRLTLLAFK